MEEGELNWHARVKLTSDTVRLIPIAVPNGNYELKRIFWNRWLNVKSNQPEVPSIQRLLFPTLFAINDTSTFGKLELWTRVAEFAGITQIDMETLILNGQDTLFANRIGGCLTRLRRSRYIKRHRRGIYSPTKKRAQLLREIYADLDESISSLELPEGFSVNLEFARNPTNLAHRETVNRFSQELAGFTAGGIDEPILSDAVHHSYPDRNDKRFFIHYEPELGMNGEYANTLRTYARCASCGSPPERFFCVCACSRGKSGRENAHTVYRVEHTVWNQVLEALRKKDARRGYDRRSKDWRREMISESKEAPYTQSDLETLRVIQGDKCYYCSTSIENCAQVDHLQPLSRGGSNGLENIMLACPTCNRSKYTFSESKFWQRRRRRVSREDYLLAREAAKEMKKAKRRYMRASM